MAWLTANAPTERRGEPVGGVMGLVSAGSIAGPAFGALGGWTSPELAFSLTALVGARRDRRHGRGADRPREPPTSGMRRDLAVRSATRW